MEQQPNSAGGESSTATVVNADVDGQAAIATTARILRDGGLAVIPTDTVYGLAADAFHQQATRKIFTAKQRSRAMPLSVLVRSPKQLLGLCQPLSDAAERLMAAFWPGPLTLVVAAAPRLQWDLGETDGAIGVRMPLDDIALAVIREVGPLAVTSANAPGRPLARSISQAREQLGDTVDVYLDAGPRDGGAASTAVDLTRATPAILRSGDLDDADVLAVADGSLDPMEAAARWAAAADRDGPPHQ